MYLKSIKSSNPSYCSQQSNLEAIKTLSRSLLINFWRDDFTNASTILDFDYFEIFQFHTIIFRISPNQIFVALEPQISKNLSWTFWRRPTYTKYRGFHTVDAKFINIVGKILNEYWLITCLRNPAFSALGHNTVNINVKFQFGVNCYPQILNMWWPSQNNMI